MTTIQLPIHFCVRVVINQITINYPYVCACMCACC